LTPILEIIKKKEKEQKIHEEIRSTPININDMPDQGGKKKKKGCC
jgi:hypothetical protein